MKCPKCGSWWCWCQQPGLHIAHISIGDTSFDGWAYTKKNEHDPRFLVLLCPSCHAKHDKYGNSFDGLSPLIKAFTEAWKGGEDATMSEDIEKDLFKALSIAKRAFEESVEKDDWDLDLEIFFSVRELDCEGRTMRRITLDNEEKAR
jgi:hypothetical protein